jgi:hypothetical protein
MRNALPLLVAGSCLAMLPLLGPALTSGPSALDRAQICVAPRAAPITITRDWLGSLHGWQDSALVLVWRGALAAAKGKPGPSVCGHASDGPRPRL